jgi:Skp family chaperone for outer membrane proteins
MLKRTLGVALAVLAWPLAAPAQTAISTPIAHFSPQRAFAASPEGKDVEAKLTALQAEREKELAALIASADPVADITAEVVRRLEPRAAR